ncbi:MAG: aminotransferase class IV [Planctomycetota bacterium]
MTEPIAYLNGEFVPISQASLHVFDLGVVGGASVSEMVRTFRHAPFRLDQHLARLEQSLAIVGFEMGLSMAELKAICERVVSENAKLIPAHHDLGLIVFVTAGQNLTYLGRAGAASAKKPTVCVHTFPLPLELWADACQTGLHLVTVETRSIPDDVIDARVKHRSRLHWHLADRQAKQVDPRGVAVLTSHEGTLTETASGNLWMFQQGQLVTPATNVLRGISREVVIDLCMNIIQPVQVRDIEPHEWSSAAEAFISSTPCCLLPVTKLNGRQIGTGSSGPMYRRLMDEWSRLVGMDIIEQMRAVAEKVG